MWKCCFKCLHAAAAAAATIPFKRFVEIGRVALVNYSRLVNQNRALVDAPDMVRCQMNFKRLSLTTSRLTSSVKTKLEDSSWGKKLFE